MKVNKTAKNSIFSEERLAGGAGMKSAKTTPIETLRRLTLASLLWEDNAYIDGISASEQMIYVMKECSNEDVVNLAIEARQKQKLRHTPLFLLVHALKNGAGKLVGDALPKVITRADMITDFLALYETVNGKIKPLANQAKNGLAKSFYNFKEYHFAKYDRDNEIKLSDAIRLVHPKPRNEAESELFKRVRTRTCETPDTWEVAYSVAKTVEEKRAIWVRLITERKLGALAFLRNLRNMREVGVPRNMIQEGFDTVNGKMLTPVNFLMAYSENQEFQKEIEDFMVKTYKELPKLSGKTLFILDKSGSMISKKISKKSNFSRQDVANAMALLAVNQCEDCTLVVTAGVDGYNGHHLSEKIVYPQKGFGLFKQIKDTKVGGGGIFTRQVLEWAKENAGSDFDRIIVFSDSQDCDEQNKVPVPFAKNNYIVDVSAHKNGINFKGIWTAEVSGWSEHFLTFISAMEGNEVETEK